MRHSPLLRSATVVAEGQCFHKRVLRILSTGGGVYPSMHWGRHSPGQVSQHALGRHPRAGIPACTGADPPSRQTPPPPPTATAADGTHPTGMLSCFYERKKYDIYHKDAFTLNYSNGKAKILFDLCDYPM